MTEPKPIRVLIVDDSLFFRMVMQKALNGGRIEVVGSAGSAAEAELKIPELRPDVMTLDIEMAGMKGTDFLKKLLPTRPLPVVLVSSSRISPFEALHAGAVDFVQKPDMNNKLKFESFRQELVSKIHAASVARVRKMPAAQPFRGTVLPLRAETATAPVIAIGASTGGTEATAHLLQEFPPDLPGMAIVQHMPAGFTKMYADRLNAITHFEVSEARDGARLYRGAALIAPGERQMTVHRDRDGYFVRCAPGEKVSGHCPSVDVLFRSVAKAAGAGAAGILLTGMGKDGAAGLLEMKQAGAFTIGQDKASCVVYGMPMAAYEMGAVTEQLSLHDIPASVARFASSYRAR